LSRQAEAPLKTLAWSVQLRPESPLAQSFKALQQTIESPAEPGDTGAAANLSQARTIMIASAIAGEGRTSTASNLAIALARAGRRVCLVDADFRSPALVKIFQGHEQTGFSNVLAGVDTIAGAVSHTQIERMDLLSSGLTPRDPAALLNSERLSETLEDLTMSYDVVILDTPPVLASPDAQIIAASCDATLLVVGTDGSSRRFAEQGRDNLVAVGAQIAGIVINQAPKRTARIGDDSGRTKPPVSVETHPTAAVGGMREKRGA
jgi:capsular exopolysaccharide synthesis family protein